MDDKKTPLTPDDEITTPLSYNREDTGTRGAEDKPAPPDIVIEN